MTEGMLFEKRSITFSNILSVRVLQVFFDEMGSMMNYSSQKEKKKRFV